MKLQYNSQCEHFGFVFVCCVNDEVSLNYFQNFDMVEMVTPVVVVIWGASRLVFCMFGLISVLSHRLLFSDCIKINYKTHFWHFWEWTNKLAVKGVHFSNLGNLSTCYRYIHTHQGWQLIIVHQSLELWIWQDDINDWTTEDWKCTYHTNGATAISVACEMCNRASIRLSHLNHYTEESSWGKVNAAAYFSYVLK